MTSDVGTGLDLSSGGAAIEDLLRHVAQDGSPPTLGDVLRFVATAMTDVEHAGVTVLRPGRSAQTQAASDEVAQTADALQHELGEGPCLDAATDAPVALSADLGSDPRWPTFGPACVQYTGQRSLLGIRLPVGGQEQAALNLYASPSSAFSETDVAVAALLAPLAALALEAELRQQEASDLKAALRTSRTIGAATGILMAQYKISHDDAFAMLRNASMNLNTKLRDLAAQVERTGTLPGQEDPGTQASRRLGLAPPPRDATE